MEWRIKNLFEEDYTLELLAEKSPSPFVGFLQYIIQNRDKYSLHLKVTRKKGDKKLKELVFTFDGQDKQIVSMKDLYLMGYQSWMEDPVRFLNSLDNHEPFRIARITYWEAEEKWNGANNVMEILRDRKDFERHHHYMNLKDRLIQHRKTMDAELYKGAFFPERIKEIYADYLHELENPPEKPEPIEKPEHDHIEVDLLTILNDLDVTPEVKVEAGVTLKRYREKKEAERTPEESEKNNNALIAIKTIQEHYLK